MRAARFSPSGYDKNIFYTVDAPAPFDSSTSWFKESDMPWGLKPWSMQNPNPYSSVAYSCL